MNCAPAFFGNVLSERSSNAIVAYEGRGKETGDYKSPRSTPHHPRLYTIQLTMLL